MVSLEKTMPERKKIEAGNAVLEPRSTTPASQKHHVTLHAGWLLALAALGVIPWLVAGAFYFRNAPIPPANGPANAALATPLKPPSPGPWGRLSVTPIVVSPPLEYISSDWGRKGGADEWHFPGTPPEVMEAFLVSTGLSRGQVSQLRASTRPDERTKGLIVRPDPELVRNLSPQVRAKLYLELAKTQLNFDQANPFAFYGASAEAWLGGSLISPQTRQLVEPLLYSDGEHMFFADPEIIRSQVTDVEEQRRLAKTLLRENTVVVKLLIENESQIDGLAEYWGRGGRRTDLRPLLESVAHSMPDRSVDIVHLLPTFVRNHLYRYPRLTVADLNRPLIANCLWSSLNFFNQKADDRFLDPKIAVETLQRDYYIVESGFQLGDVVAFLDSNGNLFHVANYLADGMVFSKNGTSPVAPWTITTIDRLKSFYRSRSSNPRLIYHRRNDL